MKKRVDILLVGGGSGGHVAPLVSIAHAIKSKDDRLAIGHVGQKGDSMNAISERSSDISYHFRIQAGKFRRYHGESWFSKLVDLKTLFLNARDFFRFLIGFFQAYALLRRSRPAVIFMKGGYVCAPVGLAASLLHIPYITHDSDAMVSLAHRIIAKKADKHLTAFPPSYYVEYSAAKTEQVGIPTRDEYHEISAHDREEARRSLHIAPDALVLLLTGGGLGSRKLNEILVQIAPRLLSDQRVVLLHVTGEKTHVETSRAYEEHLDAAQLDRVKTFAFAHNLHELSQAADVIMCRASATTIAEFGRQGAACIIVPSPFLAGGHQLRNAEVLETSGAAVIIQEADLETSLVGAIEDLFQDANKRSTLRKALQKSQSQDILPQNKIAQLLMSYVHNHSVTSKSAGRERL